MKYKNWFLILSENLDSRFKRLKSENPETRLIQNFFLTHWRRRSMTIVDVHKILYYIIWLRYICLTANITTEYLSSHTSSDSVLLDPFKLIRLLSDDRRFIFLFIINFNL